tara:strand:+ start:759 stop:1157 length:399 start_codon:yes stop_codon:yes gene_type:complete
MASILRVNTLTDASSNNSTAMSTINQGTAKAWINFDGTSTGAVGDYDRDSFNISVTVDNGTGNYTLGFTSNMSNGNYSAVSGGHTSNSSPRNAQHTHVLEFTTSTLKNVCNDSASSADDWTLSTVVVQGDQA